MFPHPNSNQMVLMPSPRPNMLAKERVGGLVREEAPGYRDLPGPHPSSCF